MSLTSQHYDRAMSKQFFSDLEVQSTGTTL